MHQTVRALALSGVLAILLAPAGLSQNTIDNPTESTPTTLYFHIFDPFNKFVINTQPMNAEFFEVGGTSFPTISRTPLNTPEVGEYDHNTVYGISTAGPVEYDFVENGRPRFHPEAGIAADVSIDATVTPIVTLYATIRDIFGTNDIAPNAMADYTFRVQVREGDDPGRDTETLDIGRLIMAGQQTFHVVNAQSCEPILTESCARDANGALEGQTDPVTNNPIVTPDADGIVEFQIPLTLDSPTIPKKEAFNVRLDGYQGTATGVIEEDQFAEGYLRYFVDPTHLPRLEFNIHNPVFIEFVHPQVAADSLLIHAGVNSPFGTYGVDMDSIEVVIKGPITVSKGELKAIISANTHVHGLHDRAAEITYLYKFREENAPEGDYTIHFSVSNNGIPDANGIVRPETVQVASATAGFILSGQEAFGLDTQGNLVDGTAQELVEAPGLGLLPTAAILALAMFAIRRNVQ
jgi:hypothetical protein